MIHGKISNTRILLWQAQEATKPMVHDASASSAAVDICINGRTVLHRSIAYWHFAQGHLLETFVMLQKDGLYHPQLRLSFGDRQFFKSWRKYLAFYLAIFDHVPLLDPDCRASNKTGARVTRFRYFGMGPSSIGHEKVFLQAANTSLLDACRWLPKLHALAKRRRNVSSLGERPPQIVMLQRPNTSAGSLPGRQIINRAEVAQSLRRVAKAHGARFVHQNIDSLEPLEQIDLLLQTDVLLSYHGSGIGSGHFWMAPGTIVVEWPPPGVPYCIFAACGEVSGKAWVESSDSRTPQMEIWKPGGWNSKKPICNPHLKANQCHRTVDARPSIALLEIALAGLTRMAVSSAPRLARHSIERSHRPQGARPARSSFLRRAELNDHLSIVSSVRLDKNDLASDMRRAIDNFTDRFCTATPSRRRPRSCTRACGRRALQVWEGGPLWSTTGFGANTIRNIQQPL